MKKESSTVSEYWSEVSFFGATAVISKCGVRYSKDALAELNNCIGGLLHLGLNVIIYRA